MSQDHPAIRQTIQHYFTGTYSGNPKEIQKAFHPDARITGSIHGKIEEWSLDDFVKRVTQKPTAEERKEKFYKEIISIDQTGDAACVKARVVVGNLTFVDYIILIKKDGLWVIRYKSFTS